MKHIFNIAPTLARLCVRKISETTKREGKQRGKRTKKREANQRTRHVFQNTKILKAAPLQPIPVEPAALDVPACSQPSRAKIGKHGWTTGSPKMEPAKIEPRGGDTGVLKASGGLLGARFAPGGRKGEKKNQHCPNMDFPKLPGRSWAGLGRPPKSNPAGAKIEPREGQNGILKASEGLLGARFAPGHSETACGRLLRPCWRLLGSSWAALSASWDPLCRPGEVPGGSRGSSGRSFWKVFLKSSPRSGKITRC